MQLERRKLFQNWWYSKSWQTVLRFGISLLFELFFNPVFTLLIFVFVVSLSLLWYHFCNQYDNHMIIVVMIVIKNHNNCSCNYCYRHRCYHYYFYHFIIIVVYLVIFIILIIIIFQRRIFSISLFFNGSLTEIVRQCGLVYLQIDRTRTIYCLAAFLSVCLHACLYARVTDWLTDWPTYWLDGWLTDWLMLQINPVDQSNIRLE